MSWWPHISPSKGDTNVAAVKPARLTTTNRFLTVDEVATILGVHRRTVLRLIRDGQINAVDASVKGRASWRIDETELGRFIARRRLSRKTHAQ
jgi:excisionase family DNA binding protein